MKGRSPSPGPFRASGRAAVFSSVREVRLFQSYSHLNETWSVRLSPVLKVKSCVATMRPWRDAEMIPGERWDQSIREELQRMDIFLCLVSYQFLASDYIRDVELPQAYRREARGEIQIIPLLLYPMDLGSECPRLKKYNPLPVFGRSWREYEQNGGDYNDAMHLIGAGLKSAIEEARRRKLAARLR